MASTGTASRKMKLVAYIVHTKIGRRNQFRPGARSQCTVTMKFKPGQQGGEARRSPRRPWS